MADGRPVDALGACVHGTALAPHVATTPANERATVGMPDRPAPGATSDGPGIAVGIGLHNFSEGLAIGQAAEGGAMAPAALLIIGFALHNTTEGFGIVDPLAAAGAPSGVGWA